MARPLAPTRAGRFASWRAFLVTAFCWACAPTGALGAAAPARIAFDLPADSAERSLRAFSRQSGIEVVFASRITRGVRTNRVQGDLPPQAALEALLAGTGLVAVSDPSGAYSVRPARPRALGSSLKKKRP